MENLKTLKYLCLSNTVRTSLVYAKPNFCNLDVVAVVRCLRLNIFHIICPKSKQHTLFLHISIRSRKKREIFTMFLCICRFVHMYQSIAWWYFIITTIYHYVIHIHPPPKYIHIPHPSWNHSRKISWRSMYVYVRFFCECNCVCMYLNICGIWDSTHPYPLTELKIVYRANILDL